MSEEILKALTQLFAIITKQDGGVSKKERQFVIDFFQQELDKETVKEYVELYDEYAEYDPEKAELQSQKGDEAEQEQKLTSVKDSVKTLGLTKKINKTLTQKQRIVVLIKILELVASDKKFTAQRMEIISTISKVFKIKKDEYQLLEKFISTDKLNELENPDVILCNENAVEERDEEADADKSRRLKTDLDGVLGFMHVKSVDMYFVRYLGEDELVLNGFIIKTNRIYLFSHGSTVKTPKGAALYYSDLTVLFNDQSEQTKLSFHADIQEFRFSSGDVGLHGVKISEGPGKLIGIMGASGAGKTTLLNVLAGLEKPSIGSIKINGIDMNTDKEKIRGVIGYIAQDDLLIEELTVYENLYYNAKLCFADFSEEELDERVMQVLENLGLDARKDLKVGSVLDKTISGGQRKRLNIALELIREPAVLFVDEPTSGLSSRDSENVIDLLKELSLKGKLIFVVIHQPSSDIYKMFDKMYIMDTGGYPVFYGNPVEAISYFKKATNQVDSDRGQCEVCGNVNSEQIFNIIEARVVDEYGNLTNKRKINPLQWNESFKTSHTIEDVEEVDEVPPNSLNIPNRFKQSVIITMRDTLSKISNKQYLMINLLEAPLLAFILAFIIKYNSAPDGQEYIFRFNENIPAFMLMSIVVALFMGLSVSAEEIIRDRKILKRESFLNLSWNSYLLSKVFILFILSAIQTLTFVLIGNLILEIQGMTMAYWLVLFTTSCFANILGLNISSAFNSAITVYVLIPLLLIPQMILSGLLFSFDKLNEIISVKGKVPIVADFMASRWAYEALAVYQFKNNDFEEPYYDLDKQESVYDFKASYLSNELNDIHARLESYLSDKENADTEDLANELLILSNELANEEYQEGLEGLDLQNLRLDNLDQKSLDQIKNYLENFKSFYQKKFNEAIMLRDKMIAYFENDETMNYSLTEYKNKYHNDRLADLVMNLTVKDRVLTVNGRMKQQFNSVFNEPEPPSHFFDYRTQFFAPRKNFMNTSLDTFTFNLIVIWTMSFILYITLYFESLRKSLNYLSKLGGRFQAVGNKFGDIKIKKKKVKEEATENKKQKQAK